MQIHIYIHSHIYMDACAAYEYTKEKGTKSVHCCIIRMCQRVSNEISELFNTINTLDKRAPVKTKTIIQRQKAEWFTEEVRNMRN